MMSATPAAAQQEGEEGFRSVDPAVAGKAFRKLRCVLADAAAVAPDRLANELYSDSIISRATLRLVLENSPASIVKMLDDVEGWLERDGRHFSRLLTVFKNSSALTIDFAARLVHNYRESFVENPAPELRSICTAASELAITTPESRMMFDKLQAEAKSSELRDCFISMVGDLKQHLKEIKTDDGLPKFRDEFILKLPLSVREDNEKLFNRNNTEINKATTFDELFTCLNTHWSYLNHSLLGGIILRYGTEELKDDIKAFSLEVDEFRKVTTIEIFQEIEPSPRVDPPAGFEEFVTKHALSLTSTLEEIECIRHKFCETFHLHKFAFYLVRVLKGSVLITWLVPHSVARLVRAGMTQELKKALHIEDIMYADTKSTYKKGDDHTWVVERGEIQLTEEEIGRGGWAVVKVANFRGLRVAAKCMHEQLSDYYRDLFIREMNMAAQLRHPNIVQFVGATLQGQMIILSELMPTSLRAVLEQRAISHDEITSISLDVARALNYLHLMQPAPLIHRDISSANVLLETGPNNSWKAKVSRSVNLRMVGPGNPLYAPPEANTPDQQSPKMDIFSFGVLLIEMCTACFPEVAARQRLIRSVQYPHFVELIGRCMSREIDSRPSASEIITQLTQL